MKAKLALLLALALVAAGLLVPAAAQANDSLTFNVPTFIGWYFEEGPVWPGPDITEGFMYPRSWGGFGPEEGARVPVVGDEIDYHFGWSSFGRGAVLTIPRKTELSLEVFHFVDEPPAERPAGADDPVLSIPLDQAMGYWQEPHIVSPPDTQPFNPRIGATEWVIYWIVNDALDDPGWYVMHFYQDWTRPVNDLTALQGEDGWLDKFAGHSHYYPGEGIGDGITDVYSHFYVAE